MKTTLYLQRPGRLFAGVINLRAKKIFGEAGKGLIALLFQALVSGPFLLIAYLSVAYLRFDSPASGAIVGSVLALCTLNAKRWTDYWMRIFWFPRPDEKFTEREHLTVLLMAPIPVACYGIALYLFWPDAWTIGRSIGWTLAGLAALIAEAGWLFLLGIGVLSALQEAHESDLE